MTTKDGHPQLCGTSRVMVDLLQEVERIADSEAKVLITGESGVGKELVAQTIHARSPRAKQPFLPVNCAGLPETLLESELFGHVKGSFTGAYRDKLGKFEMADGGTVFLDEVGEMTLRMQGMLLRFLETGELQKVGSDGSPSRVDVRVLTATNRDLVELIAHGVFREDLYYRLNVIHLHVPPLRDRADDIPLLIAHFFKKLVGPAGHAPQLTPDVIATMMAYPWPGNVRELENVLERLLVTRRQKVITRDDLPSELLRPRLPQQRSRTLQASVSDDLFRRMVDSKECFWTLVYAPYMQREITRDQLREIIASGLKQTNGSYRILTRVFNMPPQDYKKFLNFLRKHKVLLPFKEYR